MISYKLANLLAAEVNSLKFRTKGAALATACGMYTEKQSHLH